jgi:hypothetical protein
MRVNNIDFMPITELNQLKKADQECNRKCPFARLGISIHKIIPLKKIVQISFGTCGHKKHLIARSPELKCVCLNGIRPLVCRVVNKDTSHIERLSKAAKTLLKVRL